MGLPGPAVGWWCLCPWRVLPQPPRLTLHLMKSQLKTSQNSLCNHRAKPALHVLCKSRTGRFCLRSGMLPWSQKRTALYYIKHGTRTLCSPASLRSSRYTLKISFIIFFILSMFVSQTVQRLHSLHSVSVLDSLGHLLFFENMVVFTTRSESSVHKHTG